MLIVFEPLDAVEAKESIVTHTVDITEDGLWDRLTDHTDGTDSQPACPRCDYQGLCDTGLALVMDLERHGGNPVETAVAA